jgi:cation diffusion facilitator family transporter
MDERAGKEKRAVALYSIMASILMIVGKAIVGTVTGSLAILTDALHSFLDLTASTITYLAVRISDKPADREHHFGHGKVESLAALAETVMLMAVCGFFVYEALERLISGGSPVHLNVWAFIVTIGAILIDITRVRALTRVAKKYKSQALAADALNFSTDILSSTVVLIGLAAVELGVPWADSVAALGVAVFIVSATVRMARQAIDVLLDRAPADMEKTIRAIVDSYPEVLRIANLRVRSDGRTTFGALDIDIDRSLTFSRASDLKKEIRGELRRRLTDTDITLTFNPVSKESEVVADTIRFVVSTFSLPLHHLIINQSEDGYFASMHVEMPGNLTLCEAHDRAEEIKQKLHEAIPNLHKAVIHSQPYEIEPQARAEAGEHIERILEQVRAIIGSYADVDDCHNVVLIPYRSGVALSCDIRLDGNLTLDQIHHTAKEVEERLRREIVELISVTLHLEPRK